MDITILFKLKKRGLQQFFKRSCLWYDVLYAFRGLEISGSAFSTTSVVDRTSASIASCYVGLMSQDDSIYRIFHAPEFYAST